MQGRERNQSSSIRVPGHERLAALQVAAVAPDPKDQNQFKNTKNTEGVPNMGWTLGSEPKVPAGDGQNIWLYFSKQACFKTLGRVVNERERFPSHLFSPKVCEVDGNWGETRVGYMCAWATGCHTQGASCINVLCVCSEARGALGSGDRAPLRFKVRISKHDHCHCLSAAATSWLCGVCPPTILLCPGCYKKKKRKRKISKTMKSPRLAAGPEYRKERPSEAELCGEEKRVRGGGHRRQRHIHEHTAE